MEKHTKAFWSIICIFWTSVAFSFDHSVYPIVGKRLLPSPQLSYEELRSIFTLTISHWDNGERITVILLKSPSMTQKRFLLEYFGLSSYKYNNLIETRMQSGRITPPIIVNNEKEMIQKVEKIKGSIGFTSTTIYLGTDSGVKTIYVY